MRIWDSMKRMFQEVVTAIEAPINPVGDPRIEEDGHPWEEDGLEVRHEPAYDSATGIESMQPVYRKKGEVQ